ncbi:methyltransferase domain-containing protein [Kutzneria viridogrisea]|uniref:Ribosomal RNA adenine dimethylase domain-containing protein n=2 Tax=Kutzneria TaxID=43356 RepID=W5VXI7_9PSEU|nr:SAM-dependent methyltransferase [Kutzneria albida]AHH93558.1 ribosomal RNA adenine dimethylase domain-containing protein [Kutzneria albida DSM 43870]MBA8929057.1 phospholipid N-methyltransferase [Kutzneria viridogrisea]
MSGTGARTADSKIFFREFLRSPLVTASAIPSSRQLAEQMIAPIPEHGDPVVVELGPGTGAFTRAIQRRLAGRGRHIAIELNPRLAGVLAERFPEVEVLIGDACTIPELLAERGLSADVVISGLPWAAYQGPLIPAIAEAMAPTGTFTQFTYVWTRWAAPSRRQLAGLRGAFEEVVLSRTIWQNVPPALVYVSRRPRTA